MINRLKAAILSMDLDEFERALEALDALDLDTLSADEIEECYEILGAACEAIKHERSADLKRLQTLKHASAYTAS